jgi:uncharacterized surface protein with fasciclin (FAS1) repeats
MKRKQTLRTLLLPLLVVLALVAIGCKKKQQDGQAAPKPGEGSGSETSSGPAAGGSVATGSAAAASATPDPNKPPTRGKNIVETAKAAGTFNTLVKAIEAAGLTDRLSGAAPFTVFAPTDEAFAKIPAKDLEALLADKTRLEALLEYHVVPGAVSSKDLVAQKAIKSVQGADLAIDTSSGIKIGGATVVTPDVAASNGLIHAIDTVLVLPK